MRDGEDPSKYPFDAYSSDEGAESFCNERFKSYGTGGLSKQFQYIYKLLSM